MAADECIAFAEYGYQTANHTVFFHNTSSSTGISNEWHWDFGDGNSSEILDPIYVYTKYGTYYCCLTITSESADGSCSDTFCMEVSVQPGGTCILVSDFEIEPLVNGEALFIPDCQTNGGTQIDGYSWVFGTIEVTDEDTPFWQFDDAEAHQVCLTAQGSASGNLCSDEKCQDVVIDNFVCELGADFKITNLQCTVDLDYKFQQLGIFTEATDFTWIFSDGTQLEGANVYHTFSEPGAYEICLLVNGNCPSSECSSEKCVTVDIVCPEPTDWNLPDVSDEDDSKDEDDVALDVDVQQGVEIRLYPNPMTDYLRIESQAGIERISALTITGQLVLIELVQGKRQHNVDVSSLTSGMYIYQVEMSDGQIVSGQITKL